MTAITTGRAAAPGPVLTASSWADRVIALVFVATVALFLIGLVAL
jgi:hypothetical protein